MRFAFLIQPVTMPHRVTTTSRLVKLALLAALISLVGWRSFAQGIITTVAGNGRIFRGDGGPAINAALGQVQGVAVP